MSTVHVKLTKDLEALVAEKVRSGRDADARVGAESPALEAALLQGVSSPHRIYGPATLARVRKTARNPLP